MPTDYDTIVLGCGTMGAATLLSLAKRGRRVLGLDRFNPPHQQGEHHGQVRMFRMSYYEHPSYVPWLRRSLEAWQQVDHESGAPLLELTGALYLGPPDGELISGSLRSAREHGLAHELLDSAAISQRFPMFRVPRNFVGVLEKDAGFIWCERAIQAMLDSAKAHGAEVRTDQRVTAWTSDNSSVQVVAGSSIESKSLVITAGPWSSDFLHDLNVDLTVTRQVQGWLTPPDPSPYLPARFPCWGIDIGAGELFYGFPALPNKRGQLEVKLARHAKGAATSPDSESRTTRPDDPEDFLTLAREYLPDLAGAPSRSCTCLYTNSPDSHFIIDRHPNHANVSFGTGFSGHGFKLAPAVGEILQELSTTAPPRHPEPFFSLERLHGNRSGGAP
jgi:sarcosine oxidase